MEPFEEDTLPSARRPRASLCKVAPEASVHHDHIARGGACIGTGKKHRLRLWHSTAKAGQTVGEAKDGQTVRDLAWVLLRVYLYSCWSWVGFI